MRKHILSAVIIGCMAASAYFGFVEHEYGVGGLFAGIALGGAIVLLVSSMLGTNKDEKKDK